MREFGDVIRFTRPPRLLQRLLFLVLAPGRPLVWLSAESSGIPDAPPNAVMEVLED